MQMHWMASVLGLVVVMGCSSLPSASAPSYGSEYAPMSAIAASPVQRDVGQEKQNLTFISGVRKMEADE